MLLADAMLRVDCDKTERALTGTSWKSDFASATVGVAAGVGHADDRSVSVDFALAVLAELTDQADATEAAD